MYKCVIPKYFQSKQKIKNQKLLKNRYYSCKKKKLLHPRDTTSLANPQRYVALGIERLVSCTFYRLSNRPDSTFRARQNVKKCGSLEVSRVLKARDAALFLSRGSLERYKRERERERETELQSRPTSTKCFEFNFGSGVKREVLSPGYSQ